MPEHCKCINAKGETQCPPHHVAICRSRNGECYGSCHPVITGLKKNEFNNWLLRLITQDDRQISNGPLSYQDATILKNKKYFYKDNEGFTISVTFSIPNSDSDSDDDNYFESGGEQTGPFSGNILVMK